VKRHAPTKTEPVIQYGAGTNGIAYQQWYWPIPALTTNEKRLIPLYTSMLTELGAGDLSYLETQQRQAAKTGNVSLYSIYKPAISDVNQINGYLVFTGKALDRNFSDLTQIMKHHWNDARFDETSRISDYLTLMSSRRIQGITGSGHSLAMQASSAYQSAGSAMIYDVTGLPAIRRLKNWVDGWKDDSQQLNVWLEQLIQLHHKMQAQPAHALLVGEEHRLSSYESEMIANGIDFGAEQASGVQTLDLFETNKTVWSTDTQVNFCSSAYKTVSADHPDSAALTVLGGVLRNNYLHTKIREQGGAYGGGASHDNSNGVFRFYSYRDPRLEETLADFSGSLNWLTQGEMTDDQVEQSVLGVIGSLDKPGSPAGEVKGAYQNRLFNRSDDFRKQYRESILSVNKEQLVELSEKYFVDENKSEAVVTDAARAEKLVDQGFDWQKI
jgi:Zn-dependent M16 (insulinase) family peptidase